MVSTIGGKVNNGAVLNPKVVNFTWTCTKTNNFASNEYRGVVNSSGLVVYKGSNTEIKGY